MLVMNSEWERSEVPKALDILVKDIQKLGQQPQGRSLEDRKLDYVRLINGAEPGSQTSVSSFGRLLLTGLGGYNLTSDK